MVNEDLGNGELPDKFIECCDLYMDLQSARHMLVSVLRIVNGLPGFSDNVKHLVETDMSLRSVIADLEEHMWFIVECETDE